jgi:hypothetical protein
MKGRRDLPFAPGDHGVSLRDDTRTQIFILSIASSSPPVWPVLLRADHLLPQYQRRLEEALDVVIRSDGTAADGAKITVNGKRSLSSSIRTRHGASKSSASMSPTLSDRRTLQPN